MKIICDSCSTKYSIADEKVRGKVFKIKCKKCSHIIVVRGAAPEQQQQGYDDQETRVVDYQGSDPQAAAAAMAAGDAVWHLVIDQQQVGPMTVQEVQQRCSAGEIDAESYVWKEGFGDWQRLGDVPELSSVLGGSGAAAAAPAPAPEPAAGGVAPTGALAQAAAASGPSGGEDAVAGMFGGPAVDDGGAQNDPADLFSAAGGDPGAADPAGDLFGGGGAAAGDDASAGLFGGAPAEAAGSGAPASVEAPAEEGGSNLTGQRNENSVLFSLSNLASLAADAPKASAPSASSSPSGGGGGGGAGGGAGGAGMAESGGQEGSGLIDIRSMAAVYLGDQQQGGGPAAPTGPAATDDLPSFGGGSAFGGGQVLLPVSQPAQSNQKALYALVGVIGILAIFAIVLGVKVLGGGGDQPQIAAQGVESGAAAGGVADSAGAGSGMPAAVPGDDEPDDEPDEAEPDEPDEPEETAAAPEPDPEPEPEPEAKDDGDDDDKSDGRSRRQRRQRSRTPRRSKPEPKREERKPPRTEKCDEVACLVDPSLPCCGGGGKSRSRSRSKSSNEDLPERPSRSDVTNGIGKVRGRVLSCGDKHNFKGTVTVKIKIGDSGRVTGASANQGSGPFKACVTGAAKRARFPKTQKGITVNYPFVFR